MPDKLLYFRPIVAALTIFLLAAVASTVHAQDWEQILKNTSNSVAGDYHGSSVAIDGNRAIVGNSGYAVSNPLGPRGGAFIFELIDGKWSQVATLLATESDYEFGYSVAISGDKAIVGTFGDIYSSDLAFAGSAYIFEKVNGTWTQTARLTSSDIAAVDAFGWSVSISGELAIAGAPGKAYGSKRTAGAAYIFKKVNGVWKEAAKLMAPEIEASARFGRAVSISDGTAVIGAFDKGPGGGQSATGAVYIFEEDNESWKPVERITAHDKDSSKAFAESVYISGNKIIVGDHDKRPDGFDRAGAAYIFEKLNGTWTETAKIIASDREPGHLFGTSVSISDNIAIIGAITENLEPGGNPNNNGAGAAYIFEKVNGTWIETEIITASDKKAGAHFGTSVSISGDQAIISAPLDNIGVHGCGSVYFFERVLKPTVATSSLTITNITHASLTLNWENGNGSRRIVVAREDSMVTGIPVEDKTYTAFSTFGNGDTIGNGESHVIYNGLGNGVTLSGLKLFTTYHFIIYEYNGSNGNEHYLTSSAFSGSATTAQTIGISQPNQENWLKNVWAQDGKLFLSFIDGTVGCAEVMLLDLMGRPQIVKNITAGGVQTLDISGLATGYYLLRLQWAGEAYVQKVLIR